MKMMDLYNEEYARDALNEAIATRKDLMDRVEELNTMIFILNYFLSTGEPLDPSAFGYGPEEDSND